MPKARKAHTQMVRMERETVRRLKELQEQLEDEGREAYTFFARDWHSRLGLSLDAVVQVLLKRNDDHLKRGRKQRSNDHPSELADIEGD